MPKQPKKADEISSPPAVARPCRASWCSRCPAEMKAARQAERLPKKQSMPHIISLCAEVTAVPLTVKAARSSGVFAVLSDRKTCEFLRVFAAVPVRLAVLFFGLFLPRLAAGRLLCPNTARARAHSNYISLFSFFARLENQACFSIPAWF